MKNKYITVLDFEIDRVFQYKVSADNVALSYPWNPDCESIEEFLTNKGHNLTNCEWMVHDIKEIVDPTIQRITN